MHIRILSDDNYDCKSRCSRIYLQGIRTLLNLFSVVITYLTFSVLFRSATHKHYNVTNMAKSQCPAAISNLKQKILHLAALYLYICGADTKCKLRYMFFSCYKDKNYGPNWRSIHNKLLPNTIWVCSFNPENYEKTCGTQCGCAETRTSY